MSPRPRKVELKPVHATVQDLVWIAIRRLRRFTVADLMKASDASRSMIERYLQRLIKAGIVGDPEPGPPPNVYELKRDRGVETPRVDAKGRRVTRWDGRERAWAAMKPLPAFTCRELAALAETSVSATSAFIKELGRAGFIAIVKKGGAGEATRYRLIQARNTGPKPPICRGRKLFDPNTGVEHPMVRPGRRA